MAEPSVICELSASIGGEPIWENAPCRVVSNADPEHPGFCRVILRGREDRRFPTPIGGATQRTATAAPTAIESLLHKAEVAAQLGNSTPASRKCLS